MAVLEKFQGFVVSRSETQITARVMDSNGHEEHMMMPMSNIPMSERPYVKAGAYFTLSVSEGRVRIRFSRRKWSAASLARAKRSGDSLIAALRLRAEESDSLDRLLLQGMIDKHGRG